VQRKEAKTTRNKKRPEQRDRHHPRNSVHLRRCGDGGCGPDAARFPLFITDEGVKVTLLPNPCLSFSTTATNASAGAGDENEEKTSKKEGDLKGHQQGEHDRCTPPSSPRTDDPPRSEAQLTKSIKVSPREK
jgi:hypothetical protein